MIAVPEWDGRARQIAQIIALLDRQGELAA
jgi:hypothetical protein